MAFEHIEIEREGAVATIVLNRPKQLNALSRAVFRELSAALDELASDTDVRAIVITGAGERAFAAGADIAELAQLEGPEQGQAQSSSVHELGRQMAALPKPIIAAINGFALGGGLELALACDIRLASDTAQLGLPEVNLGLMPGYGGTQRLPRLVGSGMAKLLMMTGERIDAAEAQRIGIVEQMHPAAELRAAAQSLAAKLGALPPLSLARIKEAVNRGLDMPLDEGNALEATLFGELTATEDGREGVQAFLQKRSAQWKGR